MYARNPLGPPGALSPTLNTRPAAFALGPGAIAGPNAFTSLPNPERHSIGLGNGVPPLTQAASDPTTFNPEVRPAPAIVIRRLPPSISNEAVGSMLIFAGDLLDTEIVRSPYPEDQGYATAVARFKSHTGALDAQQKLHGKPNTTKETNLIVEVHSGSMVGSLERRNTTDASGSRTQTSSASSAGSGAAPPARSRFNSTFQSPDKVSPPLPLSTSGSNGDFPVPESSSHFQNLFSPQSPVGNGMGDRSRVTGKSMISNDVVDDETGELLKDPVGYAKSGQQLGGRRHASQQVPVSRFGNLSLSTDPSTTGSLGSPIINGVVSPRSGTSMQSPVAATSPTALSPGANGPYSPLNYPRPQYPPINPADQNPPCNTLYVGNLPIDTSEDELKAIFSKQRGYKRLSFRTKQNGPMCFVEFEDISFATKALNELYGHLLHNSVKGGIRLSFSKNPLGVRSGQANSFASNPAMNPHAMTPGYSGAAPGAGFSAVSGPPPGLATPPGLISGGAAYHAQAAPSPAAGMDGMFSNPFSIPVRDFTSPSGRAQPFAGVIHPTVNGGAYGGRGQRYNDYTLGR